MSGDDHKNTLDSLKCLCLSSIVRDLRKQRLRNDESFLEIYELLMNIDALDINVVDKTRSGLESFMIEFKKSITSRFALFRDRIQPSLLRDVLGDVLFDSLSKSLEEEEQLKKHLTYCRSGSIIEPMFVESSRDNKGFYSIDSLIQGVKWPNDVDATRREEYLSPEDFEHIFKMTKEDFKSLDKYKRISLKKTHKLF